MRLYKGNKVFIDFKNIILDDFNDESIVWIKKHHKEILEIISTESEDNRTHYYLKAPDGTDIDDYFCIEELLPVNQNEWDN